MLGFGEGLVLRANTLTPEQNLELAKAYLETAKKAKDRNVVLKLCQETEHLLSHVKRSARSITDPIMHEEVTVLFDLGKLLESREYSLEAQAIQKKADKLR